jgi:hypothetical protein
MPRSDLVTCRRNSLTVTLGTTRPRSACSAQEAFLSARVQLPSDRCSREFWDAIVEYWDALCARHGARGGRSGVLGRGAAHLRFPRAQNRRGYWQAHEHLPGSRAVWHGKSPSSHRQNCGSGFCPVGPTSLAKRAARPFSRNFVAWDDPSQATSNPLQRSKAPANLSRD